MHRAESSPDDTNGRNKGTEAADRRLAEQKFVLPVQEITKLPQAPNRDDHITQQFAEAVDRGLDIRKWIVALIKLIGWRQALFLLGGFGSAWALAYFGALPSRHAPHSNAELALNRFSIEAIESRGEANASPPTDFIADAKSSVLISGFSAFRTLENNPDTLKTLLDKKINIYMLVLDPQSPDVGVEAEIDPDVRIRENQIIAIQTVAAKYLRYPNFHLKFMKTMPGVTGIVVDAEIEPRTIRPNSLHAKLRFQIRGFRIPQRRGFIVQVAQTLKEDNPMFNLFWEDFRTQWQKGEDPREVLSTIGSTR